MNEREINLIKDYVKNRYEEVGKDSMEFDVVAEIDKSLTYWETKRIIKEKLDVLLPSEMPEKKIDCYDKDYDEYVVKEEIKKIETQAKLMFEQQLEKIAETPSSVLLEKIYFIPKEYIKMVINKKAKGLLLYGSCGLGKSYNVKRLLKENDLKDGQDYIFVVGHITPLKFYKKLFENKDKLIILDDLNILDNKINLNMLKACLSDNNCVVEYSSPALKDIPSQFAFTGRIIILLNNKPKNDENLKAVEDRILTYHLEMDYKTKISILYDIAKTDYEGLTKDERIKIVKWIKENTNESTKNLSIRLLFMCFEFYKWNKEIWEKLAENYIQNDVYVRLIVQGCSKQDWIEQTGLSVRTMQRYKQQLKGGY